MALPTILVNSATGSAPPNASGAGPATAKTGTATTSTTTTNIDITDTVDLSGVATDGSACIYFHDTTAGHRRFAGITNVTGGPSGSTWHVTVDATGVTSGVGPVSWAIGGKLSDCLGTISGLLLENNSANGDALPGWIIQMESGHSETRSSTITMRRAGDTTNGYITLRGASGAATRPLISFSNNGNAFSCSVARWRLQGFELQNSNGTKTASVAINLGSGCDYFDLRNIKCSDSTNKFWKFASIFANATSAFFRENYVGNCASHGWDYNGGSLSLEFEDNCVFSCGGSGISNTAASTASFRIKDNIFAFNTTNGVIWSTTNAAGSVSNSILIEGNIFHGNGSDGLGSASTSAQTAFFAGLRILSNIFSYNGGYGINFSGASISDTFLNFWNVMISNNAFFTNTSGKYNGFTVTSSVNEQTGDPAGGLSSSTKDYAGTVGGTNFQSTAYKGNGYPGSALAIGTLSSSKSYRDIGLQHQDSGGGGGLLRYPQMAGFG